MVKVKLNSTYWYGNPKKRYGPGEAVDVPEGLATALGLTPVAQEQPAPPRRVSSKPRKPKASA